jgi:hypothetical protein
VRNFERTPVITASPYDYGVPDAQPVAALGAPVAGAPAAGPPTAPAPGGA